MTANFKSRAPTIVIMARLQPEVNGGVEQAVAGTIAGLGCLTDGDEQYIVVTDPAAPNWLDSYVGPNTRVVVAPESQWRIQARRLIRPILPAAQAAYGLVRQARSRATTPPWIVASYDPFVEALQAHVVHFPYQWLHLTSAPSVFNPQDVQHIHHPEFFDKRTKAFRQHMYALWLNTCTEVEVPSYASKDDLVRYLDVPTEKIMVVPKASPTELAPPLDAYTLSSIRQNYDLPKFFVLFPAQTWPHKNHIRLFEALAFLRDEHNLCLPLVCTGYQNNFWPTLKAKLQELQLTQQVRFLGFIPSNHVCALYHLAEFTVFPTLFEGGGFPLLEAFRERSPIACSHIPVLVEQAGNAAAFFDPASIEDIARALLQLHNDSVMRDQLCERGIVRLRQYSWDHTARTYRALYRRLGGYPVTAEDSTLIEAASRG